MLISKCCFKFNKSIDFYHRYEVWLEAIGSLLCFNKDFHAKPVIFCGTCNQLDVRFYSVANAAQTEGLFEHTPAVKFVIQNLFSLKIVDIDSFLQFSMFLWRMKQFRYVLLMVSDDQFLKFF